jgi:four helix bundle protein
MRDHRNLKAFQLADALALEIYRVTASFPREEQFGLVSQMRRAAVAIASNIVEGCARHTQADLIRFLDIAYGSARELEYQATLAERLNYAPDVDWQKLHSECEEVSKVLSGLIRSLRK